MKPYLLTSAFLIAAAIIGVLSAGRDPAAVQAATPKPSVHGAAVFTANTGAITGLHVSGCVSGVTYTTVGQYAVSLDACPADYLVEFSAGDSINVPILNIYPAASYSPSGFSIGSFGNGGGLWYDPAQVFVAVIGD
jgi:hypothetical protein